MGLSAFNAMRAREKAKAEADAKNSASTIKVQEIKAPVETSEENTEAETSETAEKKYNFQKKKTDAEKLKKKE
nr:MAG TPA: hypothetical protein [Caudoviricetes sp.]